MLNHMGANRYDDPRLKRHRSWSATIWSLSSAIGMLTIGVVLLVLVLTIFAGQFHLIDTFGSVIPQPVHDFFNRHIEMDPAQLPEGVKEGIRRAAPQAAEPREKTARFTVGASEADVLKIQGRPSRIAGSTWFYGDSEVQFIAGHVVSWKNSSRNPLRIR